MEKELKKILIFIFIIASIMSLVIPYHHDYGAYVRQWNAILQENNPYIGTGNAYGAFYNFFAYLGIYQDQYKYISIQRFIFVLSYLIASYFIFKQAKKIKLAPYILILLFLNPLFWIFSVKYGSNDSFLAGMTLFGFFFYNKKEYVYSAIFFSIAICFKFTPVFIVPFFIFSRNKVNFKFLITLSLLIFITYLIAFLNWGESILEPFLFGNRRASTLFSIFRFIRGTLEPLSVFGIKNLDSYSTILIFTSFLTNFFFYLRYNLDRYISALLSISFVILFYKVGHHQFYIILLLLSAFVFVLNYDYLKNYKQFWYPFTLFWMWIFFFTILFDFTDGYYFGRIVKILGLPTFLLHSWCNINLIKLNKIKYKQNLII
jgi:hypothetical protein